MRIEVIAVAPWNPRTLMAITSTLFLNIVWILPARRVPHFRYPVIKSDPNHCTVSDNARRNGVAIVISGKKLVRSD